MYKYKRNLNHIKLIHYYHIISVLSCKIYIQKKKKLLKLHNFDVQRNKIFKVGNNSKNKTNFSPFFQLYR